ncbi:Moderate conductance mechanosensitive channel YbiO [Carnimonas sp. R-84981]
MYRTRFYKSVIMLCLMALIAAALCIPQGRALAADDSNTIDTQQLVKVLSDDQQRAALIKALEQVEDSTAESPPEGDTATAADPDEEQGILGAITTGFDSMQDGLTGEDSVATRWKHLWNASEQDAKTLSARNSTSFVTASTHFAYMLILWGAAFVCIRYIGRTLLRRGLSEQWRTTHRQLNAIIDQWLIRPIPAALSMLIALSCFHWLIPQDLGASIALALCYAFSLGTLVASICLSLAMIGSSVHRGHAMRILAKRAYIPLSIIIALAGLSNVLTASPLTGHLGESLSALTARIIGVIGCIALIVWSQIFRRAVGHLIYNGSLAFRHERAPSIDRSLAILAKLWPLSVTIMCVVMGYRLVMARTTESSVFIPLLVTTAIVVIAINLMALIRQKLLTISADGTSELSARLRRLLLTVANIIIVLISLELISRVWGGSFYAIVNANTAGRLFSNAVLSCTVVVIIAFVCWIVVDGLIKRALDPSAGRRNSMPSLRIRTLLPLLRNVVKIILSVITVITVLSNIGINVGPLIASAGVVGLAISFGSQQLVKDVITGFFNIIEDTMSIGDYVEVNGRSGTVESISIRTLSLRDDNGALVSIPFSQITAVRNTSRKFAYAVIDLRFTLDSDLATLLELVKQTGDEISHSQEQRYNLLGLYENKGLTNVTNEGYLVGGRFRTTVSGSAVVKRAFYLALAQKVQQADNVSFSRTYTG